MRTCEKSASGVVEACMCKGSRRMGKGIEGKSMVMRGRRFESSE